MFTEGGIDGLTISAIAKRAGMSRRTLYEIFGDRETLLLAYLDDLVSRCLQPLSSDEQELPLNDRLRLLFQARTEWGSWDLPLAILRLAIDSSAEAPSIGQRCLEIGGRRVEAMIREELERAVARGEVGKLDTAIAAAILRDMIQVPVVDALLDNTFRPDAKDRRARTELALDIFLAGIGSEMVSGASARGKIPKASR
nr:TetR/AcrR family transcriptional regulator [Pseudoruegeria sp. HB172150]